MSLYSNLLFLHGHIADSRLALELSAAQASAPDPTTGTGTAPGITPPACRPRHGG